ncbi:hypothetical protein PYW08_005787 [Mythimna loreyi]|uniref:Uncharacterized protein n=1 Tax=Mythimna loreyi TaxID=667449 RepID=A0ACC2QI60_9NEOP|nr:hypothetical protein PYW08_005787 [Mythimna loreyi]
MMPAERSAGLVIFRNVNQAIQFLMLQSSCRGHHWTPPKGHVEKGEPDFVAALRETKEEAGLSEDDLEIYRDVSKVLNYKVEGNTKGVVYWLAKLKNPETKVILSDESQDLKWLPLKEAQDISGFDDMKQLLLEFNEKATVLSS